MRLRSLIFVPGDRPDRFDKAVASGADGLILDLEDSVTAARKDEARAAVAAYLKEPRPLLRFVRLNPLDSAFFDGDVAALAGCRPDGFVLPKAEGAGAIRDCVTRLGATAAPILPVATETPAAIFELGSYREVAEHLAGLTWGAEDLPAAVGAATSREKDGSYTAPYEMVRSLTLFAAHAAGVPALETVYPAIRDLDGLKAYAERGRRDGFTGMMAIHPSQVAVINAAFTPSEEELAHARRIVAAFAANPEAGALQIDGQMIDAPHLKQARRLLALAGA